jgi:elongation factor 1-alpha
MEKLREEAKIMNKASFEFAFFCDKQKESRERGVTISCATKEFYTDQYHYTIIDAPGHRDFIKNMISGASQADVAVLMLPADAGFTVSIQKGDHKAGEVQGQTRQHARLAFLLGIKQLIVCVNKMDCDTAKYSEERFKEVKDEVVNMLGSVGWNKQFVKDSVPIIPISGYLGENLFKKSDKMPWWKGVDVKVGDNKVHVDTLYGALDKYVTLPKRNETGVLRMPVSGIYNIKGVGDVIAGRIEQGTVVPQSDVVFIPTHTETRECGGKVFTIEMHHKKYPSAGPGDNVGLNIKGLTKENMPKSGDIMILRSDATLKPVKKFTAQIQVLDHPGELKAGYTPIGFVRTSHAPVKLESIKWKSGKETNNQKVENPVSLKANEMGEVVFVPQMPLVVDTFKNCEGLGRMACLDGNSVIMLGRITEVEN